MPGSKRIGWWILSGLSAALAGFLARQGASAAWRLATGDELPPEQDERATGLGEAVAWAAGIGAAVGVARVLSRRGAATAWEKAVGEPPPGDGSSP
jgi:hypothetical protein